MNGAKYRAVHKKSLSLKNRIARYGLPRAVFEALWKAQKGACAICHIEFAQQEYHIDHDHSTGVVRGILCVACNVGLGVFKDMPQLLMNALAYLECPPTQSLDEDQIISEVSEDLQFVFMGSTDDD